MTLSHSSRSSACGDLRMLMPALLTRMSIRPSSRLTHSTMSVTAALSVTSAVMDIALAPACLSSATAAADFASLRPTIAMPAPASANPCAMPRPMPPLPPVTIATLPPRSNGSVFIVRFPLAFALPDQDQTESCKRRAVTGPLDLVDHKARWRPGDRAGALTDPEQTYGERKKADGQKQFAHGLFSRALVQLSCNGGHSDALRSPRARARTTPPRSTMSG